MQKFIVRPAEIKAVTGISRTSAYCKINPKSHSYDVTFPKPIRLGAKSVGWRIDELQAWLESRSRGGGAA
jgi:prophage regulatory protein